MVPRPSSHAGPGTRLFPPLKRGDGKRLALSCSQATQTMMLVYSGGTSPSLLTCLHLLPRPAAHSPRPPSGGWRRGTAGPEGRGEASQQLSTARAQNLKREDAGLGQWTELESRDPFSWLGMGRRGMGQRWRMSAGGVLGPGAQGRDGMRTLTRKHMKSRASTVGTPPKGKPCRTVLRIRAL